MKKIHTIYAILLLLAFSSCDKYLDIKPKGIQIPEFYDDYIQLMNNKTLMYADEAYVNYITDDALLGESTLDYGRFDQAQEDEQNLYTFAGGPILSSGMSDFFWEDAYKRIYYFNVVINNAGDCKDASESEKQGLIAEAKVARAFEYLKLVNVYAKHYDPQTSATDYGVPVLLSEDINASYERNTVKEVYDQIFRDLDQAQQYIPDKPVTRYRTSRQLMNGFMAKMYLYMGNYKKSNEFAVKALAGVDEIINLTGYEINPKANGVGRIYDPVTGEAYPSLYENPESIYSRLGKDILYLSRSIYASKDLLECYKKDLPEGSTDKRRELHYADNSFKLYNSVYKFPGKSMYVGYIDVNSGFNVPDLYLILAETYARLDDKVNALKYLNKLRDNRITNNVPLLAKTAQDALRLVLEERRREFAFCGSTRLIDLKRLNKEAAFSKEIIHTLGDTQWILPPNDSRYILPVPPRVLEQNPSIPVYDR